MNGGTVIMPKLALIATIDVVEGQRDRLLPLLRAHGARSLKDEPGTLQFEVLLPRDDDTKLLVYEVYRDDGAFEDHLNAVSIARFRKETDGMFEKIYATRCTPAE
jgi:autoinducer 2-degrading protein